MDAGEQDGGAGGAGTPCNGSAAFCSEGAGPPFPAHSHLGLSGGCQSRGPGEQLLALWAHGGMAGDGVGGGGHSRSAPLPSADASQRKSPATVCGHGGGAVGHAAGAPGGRGQAAGSAQEGMCLGPPGPGGRGPLPRQGHHSQGSSQQHGTQGSGPRAPLPGSGPTPRWDTWPPALPEGAEAPGLGGGIRDGPPGLAWQVAARRNGAGKRAPGPSPRCARCAQGRRGSGWSFHREGPFLRARAPASITTCASDPSIVGTEVGRGAQHRSTGLDASAGFVSGRGRVGTACVPGRRSQAPWEEMTVASTFPRGQPETGPHAPA